MPDGAALFVGNHNAGLMAPEGFILGLALYDRFGLEGLPFGLGHEVALSFAPFNRLIVPLGAVRASHENAERLFAADHKVLVYPGGDIDAMRPFRHRDRVIFGPRVGFVRLAIRHGVPIVPVVTAGAHASLLVIDDLRWLARMLRADRLVRSKVWPISVCLPWGVVFGPFLVYVPFPTRIVLEILPPIEFDRSGASAAADDVYVRLCKARIHGRMQAGLSRLAAERRGERPEAPWDWPLPAAERSAGSHARDA